MEDQRKISVIGLGYVGLPVAVAFGLKQRVIGFDINPERIQALNNHQDKTNEVDQEDLAKADIVFTSDPNAIQEADFHIISVPTPVNGASQPDLRYLIQASKTVGAQLKKGDIVVYESTVYPGATEEDCVPILETVSKLSCGVDFFVGYSPERINPGDKSHSFTNVQKVVSGQDEKTALIIASVYNQVVEAGVYMAPSIKVAEAAKVIENTQRDLNIALMNELAIIFHKMGIDTHEVLKTAGTKWNFLPFTPGLVGGHCIGVDPYYLTYKSKKLGYRPEVILAGRRINDGVGQYVASETVKKMVKSGVNIRESKVAVLGLTFKENCPDLRNSKVIDVIKELKSYGIEIIVHDPIADKSQAKLEYGIDLLDWNDIKGIDAMIFCVAHQFYLDLPAEEYAEKFRAEKIISDVKAKLDLEQFKRADIKLWRL